MVSEGTNTELNINYQWIVLDTIRKMRDANARGDEDEYYKQYEFAMQLLLSHIPIEERERIEADHSTLKRLILKIEATEPNEQTKKRSVLKLKTDFADSHRYYIMFGLSKAGITRTSDDGLIDFTNKDIEEMKKVIRVGGGIQASIEKVKGVDADEKVS